MAPRGLNSWVSRKPDPPSFNHIPIKILVERSTIQDTTPAAPHHPTLGRSLLYPYYESEEELDDFQDYKGFYDPHIIDFPDQTIDFAEPQRGAGARDTKNTKPLLPGVSLFSQPGSGKTDEPGSPDQILRIEPGPPVNTKPETDSTEYKALEAKHDKLKGNLLEWQKKWETERMQHQRTWDGAQAVQLELDYTKDQLQRVKEEFAAHRERAAARVAAKEKHLDAQSSATPTIDSTSSTIQPEVVADSGHQDRIDALARELKESQNVASYWQDQAQKDRTQHATTWSKVKTLEEELLEAKGRIAQLEALKGVVGAAEVTRGQEVPDAATEHTRYRERQASLTGAK